jgi:chemotaxis protein MotB
MAIALSRRRQEQSAPYWPGFVDALAQLLLVIIFLLSVFMVAQFLLAREISGQDSALGQLRSQIAELTELLALEKSAKKRRFHADCADRRFQCREGEEFSPRRRAGGREREGQFRLCTISGLRTDLDKERISAEALAKVELLNQQIAAMRRQLSQLNSLLTDSESRNKQSEAQIADLGKRLNSALAQRVQELARYRSEFFGRLRQILSQRSDILVVGDRFVFQSEVLFDKGSAILNKEGQMEMLALAEAVKQLETEIPSDIAWVLRVDGHTDVDPILSLQFKSNWELSAGRSIAVVNFLIANGVMPKHLVAAGYGGSADRSGFHRRGKVAQPPHRVS